MSLENKLPKREHNIFSVIYIFGNKTPKYQLQIDQDEERIRVISDGRLGVESGIQRGF